MCLAGYDDEHHCIRPVLPPPGITEKSLFAKGSPLAFPFASIQLGLTYPAADPPHTEDYHFDPNSLVFVQKIEDREGVLKWSMFPSVEDVFGQTVQMGPGFYVMDCHGERSVGTIRPAVITKIQYEQEQPDGAWDYRIHFYDGQDCFYRLKVTDLTWHYYCDSLRGDGQDATQIALDLTKMLRSRKVYLRIGLARGWAKFPDRCYLQVNGIYTFPDYLEGRVFSDFYSKS